MAKKSKGPPSQISSAATRASAKSQISKLEKDLHQEKQARLNIQEQIEHIKEMNSKIGEKLGIKL